MSECGSCSSSWAYGIVGSLLAIVMIVLYAYVKYLRVEGKVEKSAVKHGGQIVAAVLRAHGVKQIFTLVGGHISPILVACEKAGIKVVDTRHEVSAVFAADAVARLGGVPGVVAVTAGPGLTNTITAIKNAQMAESPVVLIGGAAAGLLKGRGALQDIDQMALFKPLCKYCATVTRVRDIASVLVRAFQLAQSGVPGPVFVELPIDTLYPYTTIVKELTPQSKGPARSLSQRVTNWYLNNYVDRLFGGAFDDVVVTPLPVDVPRASRDNISNAARLLRSALRPVILLGSQATLPPTDVNELQSTLRSLGVPCFLGGMSRGLLGRSSPIQMRHCRKDALKEADVVILAGAVCDFRLNYGRVLSRKSTIIAVNRNRETMLKNSDMFWSPTLTIQADVASFIVALAQEVGAHYKAPASWVSTLQGLDAQKEEANASKSKATTSTTGSMVDAVGLLQHVEAILPDNALLVADGGDFVGTAAYILRPRAPLHWLDPGAFGTLGVGGGFALGAKLARPDAEVWIVYGDGSLGYSVAEFDTFARFKLPVIALVGNDGCWGQIAREQEPMFGSLVACSLARCDYHVVAEGYGGVGLKVDSNDRVDEVLAEARRVATTEGRPVLINAILAKSNFREGSISV